jgi:hypothetical protein
MPGGVKYPYRMRYFFAQQLGPGTAELFFLFCFALCIEPMAGGFGGWIRLKEGSK